MTHFDTNNFINTYPQELLFQTFGENLGVARQVNKKLHKMVNDLFKSINEQTAKAYPKLLEIIANNINTKEPDKTSHVAIAILMFDHLNTALKKEGILIKAATLLGMDRINVIYQCLTQIPQTLKEYTEKDRAIKAKDFTFFVSFLETLNNDIIHMDPSMFGKLLESTIRKKNKRNLSKEESRNPEDLKDWKRVKKDFTVLNFSNTDYKMQYLPQEISDIKSLRSLHLEGHALAHVPPQLSELKLSTLSLGKNPLMKMSLVICKISTLKKLSMPFCQLLSVPPEIGKLIHLKVLNLHGNHLSELPSSFTNLKKLKDLDLSENCLLKIPAEIEELPKLKKLKVEDKTITMKDLSPKLLNNINLHIQGHGWEKKALTKWGKAKKKLKISNKKTE